MINNTARVLMLLLLFLTFNFISCNTYFWQPIPKMLEGSWLRTPFEAGEEERWIFDGDSVRIFNNTLDFTFPYIVDNNFSKDYVIIDGYLPDGVDRWYVVHVSKTELYLLSLLNEKNSGYHRTFWKDE
ncbi:MAG: hypothetical protein IIA45_05360 [Bacteroidetes bacterium]|nr:hypothetical protein [Bacteroidota bacterium]